MIDKRPWHWITASLCLASLSVSLLAAPEPSSTDNDNKLKALQEQIKALRGELDSVRSEHSGLRNDLRDAEKRIASVSLTIKGLGRELAIRQNELRRLSGERRELQQSMRAHYAGIARQIRASYVMGRQEYLKLLLNQQDPAAVSRTLVYYDYFNRARVKQIDAIDQDLAKLAAVEQRMRDKAAELEASKQRQEEEKRHLLESQTERSEVLAKLENRIESGDQRLKSMLGDEQALIRLIESLRPTLEELAIEPGEQVAFAKQKGKLPWPVKGKISARYGTSRGVGDLKWRGVLITATEGSEVRAISHGRAVFSDWLRGFGMLLIVDHGDGYMTLYGHNQSLYKEVGDWINAGEVIASVGQSGGRQQDGLYFEIRYKGQPTNPIKWCRATPG